MSLRCICAKPRWIAMGAGLCLLGLLPPALAAPLDKAACAKLTLDMQNMKMLEVDKLMDKGPAWAASNLSDADLSLVRQYIDLDEQLKFRCSAPGSLVHLKHLDDEDDESGGAKQAPSAGGEAKKGQTAAGQEEEAAPPPGAKQKAAKAPAKKSTPQPQNATSQ